jgi:hypothetical protein
MKPRSRFMRSPDSKSIARSMSWLCAKDDGPLSGAFGAIFFDQTALTIGSKIGSATFAPVSAE